MSNRIDLFRQALERDPGNELARFSLAKELFEQELYNEALEHYEGCLKINPSWMRVHIQIGHCCAELDEADRAIEALNHAKALMLKDGDLENMEEVNELLERLGEEVN